MVSRLQWRPLGVSLLSGTDGLAASGAREWGSGGAVAERDALPWRSRLSGTGLPGVGNPWNCSARF
jgi:hypothetical protein